MTECRRAVSRGVAILVALQILGAILLLLQGLSFAMLAAVSGLARVTMHQIIFGLLGAFFMVVAFSFFLFAYGLMRKKRWVLTWSLIFAFMSIGGCTVSLYVTGAIYSNLAIIVVSAFSALSSISTRSRTLRMR